nr:unnamed protein product [Digitaria exilis]
MVPPLKAPKSSPETSPEHHIVELPLHDVIPHLKLEEEAPQVSPSPSIAHLHQAQARSPKPEPKHRFTPTCNPHRSSPPHR